MDNNLPLNVGNGLAFPSTATTYSVPCKNCGGCTAAVDLSILLLSNPPQYTARCNKCGYTQYVPVEGLPSITLNPTPAAPPVTLEALEQRVKKLEERLQPPAPVGGGISDTELREIGDLADKATGGSWSWEVSEGGKFVTVYSDRHSKLDGSWLSVMHGANLFGRLEPDANGVHNLEFICRARKEVPRLVAEIHRLKRLVKSQTE